MITAMLTGDAKNSAKAVACEVGIDEVYAQLLPEEKLTHLKKIRTDHGAVMFVGDGINDAPVLAGADVGAAMGSGADAAIEAADVVFMTSSVDAIPGSRGDCKAYRKDCYAECDLCAGSKIFDHGTWVCGMCKYVDGGVRRYWSSHALCTEFCQNSVFQKKSVRNHYRIINFRVNLCQVVEMKKTIWHNY